MPQLQFSGYAGSQARNLCLESRNQQRLVFVALPQALALVDSGFKALLAEQLTPFLGFEPELHFEARDPLLLDNFTQRRERIRLEHQQALFQQLDQHPQVQELKARFGIELDFNSIVSAAALQENRQD